MDEGVILDAMPWGAGRIRPDDDGPIVVFTARVFDGAWEEAVVGRRVEYQLYVGTREAKRVVGL